MNKLSLGVSVGSGCKMPTENMSAVDGVHICWSTGEIQSVDEKSAFSWEECDSCGSDQLAVKSSTGSVASSVYAVCFVCGVFIWWCIGGLLCWSSDTCLYIFCVQIYVTNFRKCWFCTFLKKKKVCI